MPALKPSGRELCVVQSVHCIHCILKPSGRVLCVVQSVHCTLKPSGLVLCASQSVHCIVGLVSITVSIV